MNPPQSLKDIQLAVMDTSVLKDYQKKAAQTARISRIKIDRGHQWLVRFLPFAMCDAGLPFAHIAQHWIGGKPCLCKQYTDVTLGGDPNYACPICEVADYMYSNAPDENERDDFYQVQMREAYTFYCLVFAKENDRGDREDSSEDLMFMPHEFNVPKSSAAQLLIKIERAKQSRGASPDRQSFGIMSLEDGCDVWAQRDKKNSLTFELTEDGFGPIFAADDLYEERIIRVWKQLKRPIVKFLDDSRYLAIADKLQERAFEQAGKAMQGDRPNDRGNNRSRHTERSHENDSNDQQDEQPRATGRNMPARPPVRSAAPPARQMAPARPPVRSAAPPARVSSRFASAQAAIEPPPPVDESDQLTGAEVPVSEAEQDAPQQEQDAPQQEQGDPQGDQNPQDAQAEQDAPQQEQDAEAPPRVNRNVGATPRPAAVPSAAILAGRRAAMPPAAPAGRGFPSAPPAPAPVRTTGRPAARIDEDPEELPEEARDPAPPAPATSLPPAPVPRTLPRAGQPGMATATSKPSVPKADLARVLGNKIKGMAQQPGA